MPSRYPSGVNCWRWLREWEECNVWFDAWRALLGTLDQRGLLRWEETFLDGTFAAAKKWGAEIGKTKRGKGTKWMVLVDGQGVPLGTLLASEPRAEILFLSMP